MSRPFDSVAHAEAPKMRGWIADQCGEFIPKVRGDKEPKCPHAPDKLLKNCLRESVKCPQECPHYDAWTGPIPEK